MNAVAHLFLAVVDMIPNPPPVPPAGVAEKVNKVLGLIKWGSLMAALAVLFGAGGLLFASERGHGSGLSPQLKSTLGSVMVVLVIVGAATQIVQFLS